MSSSPWELAWKQGRWYEASGPFPRVVEFGKYLKQVGARTVLDFGSGAGRHTLFLAKEEFDVVAFDLSRSALSLLNERTKVAMVPGVFPALVEMSMLPFIDESFDAVVSNNVLHHSGSNIISRSIREVRRIMKLGAVGYFSVLSRNDYKYRTGKLVEPATYVATEEDELGIVHHFFSEQEIRSLFADFDILSLEEELIPIEKGTRGHFHLRVKRK